DKPSFICAKTLIGFGAPKEGTQVMHGEAMGDADIAVARRTLGWSSPPFEIPADISAAWDRREKGAAAEAEWRTRFNAYAQEFPALAAELERRMAGDLPAGFDELLRAFAGGAQAEGKSLATRQSSQATLNAIGPSLPELLGGSADLTPSNGTWRKDSVTLSPVAPAGNYIHYGLLDAHTGDIRLYPRFDRTGRGWAHTSAHRASCKSASHPTYGPVAALRCG